MIVLAALAVFVEHHWIAVVRDRASDIGRAGECGSQHPTGKNLGELLHGVLIVGRNRVTGSVHCPSSVLVQYESPDGKELEDRARSFHWAEILGHSCRH